MSARIVREREWKETQSLAAEARRLANVVIPKMMDQAMETVVHERARYDRLRNVLADLVDALEQEGVRVDSVVANAFVAAQAELRR